VLIIFFLLSSSRVRYPTQKYFLSVLIWTNLPSAKNRVSDKEGRTLRWKVEGVEGWRGGVEGWRVEEWEVESWRGGGEGWRGGGKGLDGRSMGVEG
jgi:hypothetical protein